MQNIEKSLEFVICDAQKYNYFSKNMITWKRPTYIPNTVSIERLQTTWYKRGNLNKTNPKTIILNIVWASV